MAGVRQLSGPFVLGGELPGTIQYILNVFRVTFTYRFDLCHHAGRSFDQCSYSARRWSGYPRLKKRPEKPLQFHRLGYR